MAFAVEHDHRGETSGARHIYLAIGGREMALQFAKTISVGNTVWCIQNDAGDIIMNREQVLTAVDEGGTGLSSG